MRRFYFFCWCILSVFALSTCQQMREPVSEECITIPKETSSLIDLRGQWAAHYVNRGTQQSLSPLSRTLSVPANWYLEGFDVAGVVEYERKFFLPQVQRGILLRLVFEGVDYQADVWLNGTFLGKHTGYFQPFSFVVNAAAILGAENTLRVRVSSPNEVKEDWSLHKRLVKGIFAHHDTRPGGAWSEKGQDANTGGIWGNVYLTATQNVVLERVQCISTLNGNYDTATLFLSTAVRTEARRNVIMTFLVKDSRGEIVQHSQKEHYLHAGLNMVFDTMQVTKPLLWHTYDVGQPHLYTLTTQVSATVADTSVFDSRVDKFGIRDIRYDAQSGQWRLNGRRLFLRGTNYIGTQFLSTMNRAAYDRDAVLMKEANINAVRVHAHIARKEWYDACDSLGLLVWQDFPLQWGYSDDAEFVQTASHQVRDMIHLLFNHPSIAAWCLQNEPPFDADWMQYKYPKYSPLQNHGLNVILTRIARSLDSTRYVHPFSATSEHRWEGWYFGVWTDYAKPTKEKLITEFGAQGLPQLETLALILGEKPTIPTTDAAWQKWEYHNFQRHETFDFAKVPLGANVEEFVRNSQEHQSRVTELAAESYRLQRFVPVGAIFQFMFVEAWASMNWGIVDYRRLPKPAFYALRDVYQPTLIATTLDSTSGRLGIVIVNDLWQSFPKAHLHFTLETKGTTIRTADIAVSLPSDAKIDVASLLLPEKGTYRIKAAFLNDNGDTLSRRTKVIDYDYRHHHHSD